MDIYGQIQYIDNVDTMNYINTMNNRNKNNDVIVDYITMSSTREIKYEYEYNIRYLNESSEIITKETYDISGGHIAAYVGCTYHCG